MTHSHRRLRAALWALSSMVLIYGNGAHAADIGCIRAKIRPPAVSDAGAMGPLPRIGETRKANVGDVLAEVYPDQRVTMTKYVAVKVDAAIDVPIRFSRVSAKPTDAIVQARAMDDRYLDLKVFCVLSGGAEKPEFADYSSDCLWDLDDDGKFESVTVGSCGPLGRWQMPPQPYTLTELNVRGLKGSGIRFELVYLGQEAGTLRVQYREYEGRMIRQAFTQELTVPLATVPSIVRIKGLGFEVQSNTGGELTYRIIEGPK